MPAWSGARAALNLQVSSSPCLLFLPLLLYSDTIVYCTTASHNESVLTGSLIFVFDASTSNSTFNNPTFFK
jgi:hypothetical protein